MWVIFHWRNHPESKLNSFSSHSIDQTTHAVWFKNRITRISKEPFYILEQKIQVAVCRFDISPAWAKTFDVSILVNPNFQRKGIGKLTLRESCQVVFRRFPDWTIHAKVKIGNVASQRIFEANGFQIESENMEFALYSISPSL